MSLSKSNHSITTAYRRQVVLVRLVPLPKSAKLQVVLEVTRNLNLLSAANVSSLSFSFGVLELAHERVEAHLQDLECAMQNNSSNNNEDDDNPSAVIILFVHFFSWTTRRSSFGIITIWLPLRYYKFVFLACKTAERHHQLGQRASINGQHLLCYWAGDNKHSASIWKRAALFHDVTFKLSNFSATLTGTNSETWIQNSNRLQDDDWEEIDSVTPPPIRQHSSCQHQQGTTQ